MTNFYLHRDGQNHGPYTVDQLRQMMSEQQIRPEELICPEGASDWFPASSVLPSPPPMPTVAAAAPPVNPALLVTQQQVSSAYAKLKTPFLGIVFSIALPLILLAAKSDAERGVGASGRYRGAKELAQANTNLLPLAIVVAIIGSIAFGIWFIKSLKRAKELKFQLENQ